MDFVCGFLHLECGKALAGGFGRINESFKSNRATRALTPFFFQIGAEFVDDDGDPELVWYTSNVL